MLRNLCRKNQLVDIKDIFSWKKFCAHLISQKNMMITRIKLIWNFSIRYYTLNLLVYFYSYKLFGSAMVLEVFHFKIQLFHMHIPSYHRIFHSRFCTRRELPQDVFCWNSRLFFRNIYKKTRVFFYWQKYLQSFWFFKRYGRIFRILISQVTYNMHIFEQSFLTCSYSNVFYLILSIHKIASKVSSRIK